MAFKCRCSKCDTPLYFEEAVPLPQVCADCLKGCAMDRHARAQYIWCILKSYMLDECSLDCAAVSPADEKNLINEIFNSIPENAVNPDFKQVFDFLESIGGAGYGGMASYEIARQTMREYSTVTSQHGKTP